VKKLTIVILTAFYLLSVIGVSASSFYCCGVLKSTSYSIGEDHGSDSKATAVKENCCKTTKHSFKVKDNHFVTGSYSPIAKYSLVFVPFSSLKQDDKPFTKIYTAFNSHAPPLGQHASIYTLNCTYRI
jgi:hypothetical protein